MTRRKRHNSPDHPLLPQWRAALLLCLFLAVRGLVPAGFMPAPLAAGAPYTLCHGDSRSTLLLHALAHWQRDDHGAGHHHDALTAQTFADNHCSFSAGAALAGTPAVDIQFFTVGGLVPAPPVLQGAARSRAYARPPARAPPVPPYT
ncbi:hypothetical protein [Microbulbifer thermotolerans]|uniref:DUF2946 domain-containing protein n=1 Tax=Microbulbifer thermotolerans TaxID=252514 RepID=A0AB35HZI2_MICTH|nr:hypothetical protein [Microbulbifer thermotolerans]MCX2801962.1 hypothetical protein [Microbulbifer thermotolerans]MCX2832299.1 hypothetical protein [Microbulbifer thermotolerans]